ncbi:MAG: hypothetical protein JNK04_13035 [Myxococcales bacterium]|nr:hypothetical protein [Myxococcales bacterium]
MASDTEEPPRCEICGGPHSTSKCTKRDISGGKSDFVFQQLCPICGGNHAREKCPREDISADSSIFVWKKCPKCGGQHDLDGACPPPKRRRSTEPVKAPVVQAKKPRAQPTTKLVTKKPKSGARPPATVDAPPRVAPPAANEAPPPKGGPTPSKADDCTLTLEGNARVTSIGGDGKLVVKTAAGTVQIAQPCRDTTIQSDPKSP